MKVKNGTIHFYDDDRLLVSCAQAEADKRSCLSFLDHLLEEEVAVKEKRRLQTAMKTAGLPTAKSIDEYDFGFPPRLNKKESMALFDMKFIENASGFTVKMTRPTTYQVRAYW